jgi:hypothetical protein
MDLVFNELSVEPLAEDKTQAYKRVFGFLDTFKKSSQFGFNKIRPEEKNLAIRDDHGKNILTSFANKILKSPYVIEILNSLPFNPYQKEFIRKIKANGIIEIVLIETDEGLGLVLKTTGRTTIHKLSHR